MVKRIAEINVGLMTQCLTKPTYEKVLSKNDVQVLFNIAIKINAKAGGIDWKPQADAE